MLRGAACLVVSFLLSGLAAGAADRSDPQASQEKAPEQTFEGEIDVSLVTMVIRVVDTWGRPILGLKPQDFRVRVGKIEVPVVAIDWIAAGEAPQDIPEGAGRLVPSPVWKKAPAADSSGEAATPSEPGRLVVIFVQADLNPTRISGQLRLRRYTRELLGTLHPEDRVAVVSFDSHLKLWQDFARDRAATHAAIDQAMLYSEAPEVSPAGAFSLARHFDLGAARRAASPERALELTARALEPLPGEKMVIFLGWGLGRFGATGVRMTPDYKPAVKALGAARASVFVLDVTSADYHSLEVGLEGVAEATGGLYFKTFRLPELATDILARAISGYYVLTLDGGSLVAEGGKVRVELREKNGTVLARSVALR